MKPAPGRRAAALPHEVRLIGGLWRRSRLPVADVPGLRPTPDRVRETLFNWLGQDLAGWRCLDAFAGTGALGLAAASRGAAAVDLLERHPAAVVALEAAVQRLKAQAVVRVRRADALAWMRQAPPGGFDLVLLDPPFDADLQTPALAAAAPLVAPGGWLYLEAPLPLPQDAAVGGLAPWRQGRAGAVHYHLLRRSN